MHRDDKRPGSRPAGEPAAAAAAARPWAGRGRPLPARYLPATHGGEAVTGDFYDLFQARGPYWTAVMGDVCGKGTEAAKVTALARYTLRADARDHLSPAEVLSRLNEAMLAQHAPLFLTAVEATFRLTPTGLTGRLCLAGHPPALIRRADGQVQQVGVTGHLLGFTDVVNLADGWASDDTALLALRNP